MATFEQRESGWWQAKIRRKGHPKQSKTFEKKADAEAWARDVENKMDRGVFIDRREAETTTLYSALERYEHEVTENKRGKESEKYRLAAWRSHKLAACMLAAIKPTNIAAARDERLKAGAASSTVVRELALLGHVFTVAEKDWGMAGLKNPVAGIRKPAISNARDRTFLADEETRLLTACAPRLRTAGRFGAGAQSRFLLPVVRFALETSMRQGEVAGLLWENIDITGRVARLPLTKNGSARAVPLSSAAIAVLQELMTPTDSSGKVQPLPKGLVFQSTANALKIGFARAVKRARKDYETECSAAGRQPDPRIMSDLHFHDLRHVATTRLAEKLPNVIELAAVTGHKDLRMLKRYYHPRAEDLAKKLG